MAGRGAERKSFVGGTGGRVFDVLLRPDRSSDLGRVLSSTGFTSASLGFQLASKLTIGLPGLSLTTAGVGRWGLRSLKLLVVA